MFLSLVPSCMEGQVVRSGEPPAAVFAFEWFCPGVLAEMSGQLIGPCKAPGATLPGAGIRLLT